MPTREKLQELHVQHMGKYTSRLRQAMSGKSGFRIEELEELIGIWEGVRRKDFLYDALSQKEKSEVDDALYDEIGEYDEEEEC